MPTVVLWGPPCSGKSTYINERAKPGDVVVDLDRLALAFSPDGTPHHEYPEHVRAVARKARMAVVYDVARMGVRAPWTAWVIDSNAGAEARRRWRQQGARVVKLKVPMSVCIERAGSVRPEETVRRIRAWFAEHGRALADAG